MSAFDRRRLVVRALPLALSLVAVLPSGAPAKDAKPVLRLTAFAVNMTGVGRGGAGTLQIAIERWSTDAERTALINTLVESGSDKLLDAVQKIKPRAGFIRTNTSLGWDIQYARLTEIEGGGKRIVFATDRPMSLLRGAQRHAVVGLRVHAVRDAHRRQRQGRGQARGVGQDQLRQGQEGGRDRELRTGARAAHPGHDRQVGTNGRGDDRVPAAVVRSPLVYWAGLTSTDQVLSPQARVMVAPWPAGAKLTVRFSAGVLAALVFRGTRATSLVATDFV